jgi:hypothetical protein
MKRSLLSLLILASFASFAQNKTDMAITSVTPHNGSIVTPNDPFQPEFWIKNNGPASITTLDTLTFQLVLNGSPITLNIQGQNVNKFRVTFQTAVNAGDSIDFKFPYTITFNTTPANNSTFCFATDLLNNGSIDTATANNMSCSTINYPSAINEANGGKQISVYPNPASGKISFDLSANGESALQVFDLNGNLVMNANISKQSNSIDVSNLSQGLYLFTVKSSEAETMHGRFNVAR